MNNRDVVQTICRFLIEPDILSFISCNKFLRSLYNGLQLMRIVYMSLIWRKDRAAKQLRKLLEKGAKPRMNCFICPFCLASFTEYGKGNDMGHYRKCPVYNAVTRRLKRCKMPVQMMQIRPCESDDKCRICGSASHAPQFFQYNTPMPHWKLPCRKCKKITRVVKAGVGCLQCGVCCKKCSMLREFHRFQRFYYPEAVPLISLE